MKIITWNVNGLRAVRKKGFEQTVSKLKPDVICLQEPKVGRDQLDDVDISFPKYKEHYSLAKKKGYSGVLTYIKETAEINSRRSKSGIGIERFDDEGRVVISAIDDFLLYNIYFPSGTTGDIRQDYKYDFLDSLFEHFKKKTPAQRKKMIICGDYNICHKEIDIHHPKTAERLELSGFLPEERAWMDLLTGLGFEDSYRVSNGDKTEKYTWWSYRAGAREKNLGWRLDYIFVGEEVKQKIKKVQILEKITGSDHCPVMLELRS